MLALFLGASAFGEPRLETLATRSDVVWGFDFLSARKIIFTERGGTMAILDLDTKAVTQLSGVPQVWAHGQGGLLDVRVHPKDRSKIFFTYSRPVGDDRAATSVGSAILSGSALKQVKRIFSADDPGDRRIQFGSRIEFDSKGHLFVSVGDQDQRDRAQSLKFHQGKILRINEDGSAPRDNPFFGKPGAKPEIWCYGLRNPEGLVLNPLSGELWLSEMGPRGGDEVNVVKAGANYGWPLATHGREYFGPKIGEATRPGMENPEEYWVPSISPSGMTFYTGSAFPEWKGNAFVAALSGMHLRRLVIEKGKVTHQEVLFKGEHRFRNVRGGPDGFLYVSTDDGKIGRIEP